MQIKVIQRILGLLIMIFSITMLPPLLFSLFDHQRGLFPFSAGFAILLLMGFLIWYPRRQEKNELRLRDGFMIVVLFWAVLGVAGGLPLILADEPHLSVTDAIFESMSGLTTTGATVIVGLDTLPRSILFYRQQLQWLGGMGIIVLAVAILPMLGVGGMQLYKAETPGPVKDSKLTPRITGTAKALWNIYLFLTLACMFCYMLAGMGWFDALSHSFSTVAIGGYSTYDASIGHFNSAAVEAVAVIFMLLSGINFGLHFAAWHSKRVSSYLQDSEFKYYCLMLVTVAVIAVSYLSYYYPHMGTDTALRQGIFHTVSIATTTGFATTDFSVWPAFLPILLLFTSFVGGCAGSTGGGMKVVRVMLLFKQGMRELRKLVHPSAYMVVKMSKRPVPDNVIEAVWGFFAAYVMVFVVFLLLLMASGLDQVTSFSAVAASLNNLGPGLGDVAANYQGINDFAKWVLCFAMLMGRLEIFTFLVLLTPAFWRR